MPEYLKCQKCHKVFATRTRTGSGLGGMHVWYMSGGEGLCPHCFGEVIWMDDDGLPLSPYKRMKYYQKNLRKGLLYFIVFIIIIMFISLIF